MIFKVFLLLILCMFPLSGICGIYGYVDEGGVYRGKCVMGGAQLEPTSLLEAGELATETSEVVDSTATEQAAPKEQA